ncbi:histone-lysine N-methyltransferase SETMAR [Trichonephila clavipes]|nr:histone-lysine N-methyltransferase SETMAR [Trichonephila clavipes]
MDRLFICEAVAKRNEIDLFLKRMVTWDEIWVTYDNIVQKRSWSQNLYCQQLGSLKLPINQKLTELANRRRVVFNQDNARSHTSAVTRQKLLKPGWEVLMHPPYTPNLAPSNYLLFSRIEKLPENWDQEKIVKIDY